MFIGWITVDQGAILRVLQRFERGLWFQQRLPDSAHPRSGRVYGSGVLIWTAGASKMFPGRQHAKDRARLRI